MSDGDDDFPTYIDDLPPMDTEEGRDRAFEYLLADDLPCTCSIIQEGEYLVIRVRYPAGNEELFDTRVVRSMDIGNREQAQN